MHTGTDQDTALSFGKPLLDHDDLCSCEPVAVTMPPTEVPTPSVVPPQTGSGDTVKVAAEKVAFFDNGIPPQLYSLWRTQVHRGIQNWDCFGAAEAGTKKLTDFCEWAVAQPGMAPRGQVGYGRQEVKRHVRTLCNDIARKARNSRQAMWEMIYAARAAYHAEYL